MSTRLLPVSGSLNPHFNDLREIKEKTLDWSSLSPAQKYYKSVERIKEECSIEQFDISSLNLKRGKIETKEIKPPFKLEKDDISSAVIGVGLVGGVIILGSSTSHESPVSRGITPSKSNFLALFSGALLVGAGVGAVFAASSYRQLAEEIRTEIFQVFNQIGDEEISGDKLLECTQDVYNKKEASYFNGLFENCNPTPTCYLSLTKGIALDSTGSFQLAHNQYETCLSCTIENNLKDLIRYTYARSLRLDGKKPAALIQLNQINQNSPIYLLSQLETQALDNEKEVFDIDRIPFKFKCPLTLEPMKCPVYYERANHRFQFEKEAIEECIDRRASCPLTQSPLSRNDLVNDEDLASLIHTWNQTRLKT
jgi:hypothetical protein